MTNVTPQDLHILIADMDVPIMRKKATDVADLQWLMRNMGFRNSDHPAYAKAIDVLKALLKAA